MAVRLDVDAVRGAVGSAVYGAAEELLATGRLGEVTQASGGAYATVDNPDAAPFEVWAGVVAGSLVAECDCTEVPADPDLLCVHAVALTLAAVRAGFDWSSAATPPSAAVIDPKVRLLTEIAASLPARRLTVLVGEYAANDRRLETRLLAAAGKLGPPTETELATVRRTIDDLASEATAGQWDPLDVATAGRQIVAEVEVIAERPAGPELLDLVEHAAQVWDALAGHLSDAWETYEDDPEEIGGALRAVHLGLCEDLRPDPDELAGRLAKIIAAAEVASCLDEPDEYLPLLGPARLDAIRNRRG